MRADDHAGRARWATALLATVVCLGVVAPLQAQPAEADMAAALAAAVAAVREAFGADAEVTLTQPVLQVGAASGAIARAVPEPSSRTAGPVRFVLHTSADGRLTRIGRLTADVRVRAAHVRVRGRVASRATLTTDVVETARGDIGRLPFAPLPTIDEVTGATSRKPLADGEVVTRPALVARSLVVSGAEVVTVARIGALEVRGRAIAAQSGAAGDTVIVVNPDSRKRLHARVIADALVEVRHGS